MPEPASPKAVFAWMLVVVIVSNIIIGWMSYGEGYSNGRVETVDRIATGLDLDRDSLFDLLD